ncbi:alcohol dehydrogenase [candidate division BRC1 bacterium HGW-BRC1-1]|jgi:threonine dehydrogenase-like Zn-dependent dehydrogenase|nr:MAG: alcohol dehydrogenase [candidate division BRC1 bacterium HGW-BRC1-1]
MNVSEVVFDGGTAELRPGELPDLPPRHVRVRVKFSAISAGTELGMKHASGEKQLLIRPGYQACGVVEAIAPDCELDLAPGDWVACYGAPYTHHAALLNVPRNLVAKLPAGVKPMHAAFGALGTIALHAFRVAHLSLGETAAVVGLGALGNITAQLCAAAGCRTATLDHLETRRAAAMACGLSVSADMDALRAEVGRISDGAGADAIFLAVGNASEELLTDAVNLLCHRGRVVLVGTGTPALPREPMFSKEATIVVSRAGGPGRYDPTYEAGGVDYPHGLVRWTEGRNLAEFVRLLDRGAVAIEPLISDVMPPSEAANAYELLISEPEKHVGVVFAWPD